MAGGRPSKYNPEIHIPLACQLAKEGLIDKEMARAFGVSEDTIYEWKNKHPEFSEALKIGKAVADDRVEKSLYHRAIGYSHQAVKIFMPSGAAEPVYAPYEEHLPPDPTSMIFWLKNRRPDTWRDKHEIENTGTITVETKNETEGI